MKLMKNSVGSVKIPLIGALVVGLVGAVLISNSSKPGKGLDVTSANEKPAEKEVLYWVAPMDSTFRRDEPGKSPMGMDLVPVYAEEMTEPEMTEPEILYWVAPMDPTFRRDEPGKSPMGMDLVPVYAEE